MVARKHVWISGRVQGVWFRQTCGEMAEQAGVCGWVRNLPDGRVEAVFEGTEAAVEQMVAWCRQGPSRAVVTALDVVAEKPEGCDRFDVT